MVPWPQEMMPRPLFSRPRDEEERVKHRERALSEAQKRLVHRDRLPFCYVPTVIVQIPAYVQVQRAIEGPLGGTI